MKALRDRCPECGRIRLETAEQKFRRTLFRLLPPDTHERVGHLLNLGYVAAESGEPANVLLLAFQLLEQDLRAQGHTIPGLEAEAGG